MKLFINVLLIGLLFFGISFTLCDSVLETKHENTENTTTTQIVNEETQLPSTAEKLVRYRRQPPFTIVKHVARVSNRSKQRRRIKSPKIKYGPPSYSAGEPISYYKPQYPTHISIDSGPNFGLDDYQHLNLDAADFKIPSSSYEAQSMDVDFYNHGDNLDSIKSYNPGIEYSYDPDPDIPSLHFYDDNKPTRKPHQKYGVPQQGDYPTGYNSIFHGNTQQNSFHSSSSAGQYESPETYVAQNYHPPPQTISSSSGYNSKHQSYGPPLPSKPTLQYEAPAAHNPTSIPTLYSLPDQNNNYATYNKKIPNISYQQPQYNFAEPPPTVQHSSHSNYEIAYSPPAYEISSPPATNSANIDYDSNYAHQSPSFPTSSHHEDFSVVQSQSHPPLSQPSPPQSIPQPQHDYSLPSQELPLNPNHKFPTYDFPKSSYEVPIYDPIPFEASSQDERESYPPNQPDRGVISHQEQNTISSTVKANVESFSDLSDAHTSGSSRTTTRDQTIEQRKKRKRIRGSSVATPSNKHTLDVPELQAAFDSASHGNYRESNKDADVNESHFIEQRQPYKNFVTTTSLKPVVKKHSTDNFLNSSWSPMRIRTNSSSVFVPTIVPTIKSTRTTQDSNRYKQRSTSRWRNRYATTASTTTEQPFLPTKSLARNNISANNRQTAQTSSVTIEKSQSKSYYDGTIAPPTGREQTSNANQYQTFVRTSSSNTQIFKPEQQYRGPSINPKRTTKSVFDTTYFKSPHNDKTMEQELSVLKQTLPKNHKLF